MLMYVQDWEYFPAHYVGTNYHFSSMLDGSLGTPKYVDWNKWGICPTAKAINKGSHLGTYSTNVGSFQHFSSLWPSLFTKVEQLRFPSQTILMYENWVFGYGWHQQTYGVNCHALGRAVLFVDGHAKFYKEYVGYTFTPPNNVKPNIPQDDLWFGCVRQGNPGHQHKRSVSE